MHFQVRYNNLRVLGEHITKLDTNSFIYPLGQVTAVISSLTKCLTTASPRQILLHADGKQLRLPTDAPIMPYQSAYRHDTP